MTGSLTPCLFCGRTGVKLTKEHVHPRWLYRAMGIRGPLRGNLGRTNTIREVPEFTATLKVVCEECNNGWLHDLEREFRARMSGALLGDPIRLDRASQHVTAMWGLKTTMLVHMALAPMSGQPLMAPPDGFFRWLRASDQPPPNVRMWIGCLDTGASNADRLATISAVMPLNPDPDGLSVGLFYILSVGSIVFVTYLATPEPGKARVLASPSGLGVAALPQLWPIEREDLRWPPSVILTREALKALWPGLDLPDFG